MAGATNRNLGDLFAAAVAATPDATAVIQDNIELSYRELDRRADQVASACVAHGVQPGDRVAVLLGNDYRYVEIVFGAIRAGAVVVPLNPKAGHDLLRFIIYDAEVVMAFVAGPWLGQFVQATAGLAGLGTVVATAGGRASGSIVDYAAITRGVTPRTARRAAADGVCLQPYTSGSTGRPKGVLLTHAGQYWNADLVRQVEAIVPEDRALIAIPLFHKNAMITLKSFLLAGASMVIQHGFDPAAVVEAIARHRVTYTAGVPAMYQRVLAEKRLLASHDVTSLRMAATGSAAASPELVAEFERIFGAPMIEGYGLTEGGPIPLANRYGVPGKPGSCGRAVPGSDVRLVGEDGVAEVRDGEVGELLVRNPGVAIGYWKRPDATADKFRDGWLHTGDLMRRDADGYFFFVGRRDDRINVGGEQVYPKEVEDILSWHPDVAQVAVVPGPHHDKGEVPVAFVVRHTGTVSEAELKAYFIARGSPAAHPRRIHFMDALPLAGSGKPDRQVLIQLARDQNPSPPAGP